MAANETPIHQANDDLYRALSSRDLDAMDALWSHEPWAQCVHPGWPAIRGWEAIRKSWQAIFQSPNRLSVTVSDVHVRQLESTVALVTCLERIRSQKEDFLDTRLAQTTNVFVLRGTEWKLVLHQASSIPAAAPLAVPESDAIN